MKFGNIFGAIKNTWTSNGKIKFAFVALGIVVAFMYVGVCQETIMKGCYGGEENDKKCKTGEKFKFAVTLVFVKSFCGLVFVQVLNWIRPETNKDTTHWLYYASTAVANALSMVSSNMALRWCTYPMQVIFKSAKPLSVMILGLMFCKKYTIQRYLFVVVIVTGVVVFKFYEPKEAKEGKELKRIMIDDVVERDGDGDGHGEMSKTMAQILGTGLLCFSLTADGVLGAIQDKMRAVSRPTFRQLMFNMNLYVCGILLGALAVSLEFLHVVPFIIRHPKVLFHLFTLGFADAVGNVFIFTMISCFGALACSVTGTVRKLFSVVFSIIFFGNPSTPWQWAGAALVFSGLLADAAFGKKKRKPANEEKADADVEKAENNDKAQEADIKKDDQPAITIQQGQ